MVTLDFIHAKPENILYRNFKSTLKKGVNMNLSEIFRKFKERLKGKKRLWNTPRQLPDPTMAPQVGGQLFGVYLPISNFKF